jgi:hypothetical protein
MKTRRRLAAGAVLSLALIAAACGPTKISEVLANPTKHRNQTVTVRGTVEHSVSIVGRGIYRITDGDQGLWVVTQTGAPRKGARVDVTGRVQEGFDLSGFGSLPGALPSGLVLVESSHKVLD